MKTTETAVSKDNWVLVLKGDTHIYIDEEEKNTITHLLEISRPVFEIRGRILMRDSILYLVPIKDMEEAMYRRKGWVKWDCGHWRPRNEPKCGYCYYL